jgi:hypothetical protein
VPEVMQSGAPEVFLYQYGCKSRCMTFVLELNKQIKAKIILHSVLFGLLLFKYFSILQIPRYFLVSQGDYFAEDNCYT